jgi:hypothetical protein
MVWSVNATQQKELDVAHTIIETIQKKLGSSVFKAFKFFDSNEGQGYFGIEDWIWALYQIGLEHLILEDNVVQDVFYSICNS